MSYLLPPHAEYASSDATTLYGGGDVGVAGDFGEGGAREVGVIMSRLARKRAEPVRPRPHLRSGGSWPAGGRSVAGPAQCDGPHLFLMPN